MAESRIRYPSVLTMVAFNLKVLSTELEIQEELPALPFATKRQGNNSNHFYTLMMSLP